jgi:NAD(P)-dependent dehydrogenase (short-subunit alcohol dehydrogenase family)
VINPGLHGRTVLVTGASNRFGIGAAVARAFARVGATLFLHYHRTPLAEGTTADTYRTEQANSANALVDDIASLGGRAAPFEADFSDPATIPALFDAAERFCGSIDVLVNNAAAWTADTFLPSRELRRNPFIELWTESGPALSANTATRQLIVNAIAPSFLVTEFARASRGSQRDLGTRREHQHRRIGVLSVRGQLRREQVRARKLHAHGSAGARAVRDHRERARTRTGADRLDHPSTRAGADAHARARSPGDAAMVRAIAARVL